MHVAGNLESAGLVAAAEARDGVSADVAEVEARDGVSRRCSGKSEWVQKKTLLKLSLLQATLSKHILVKNALVKW